VLGCAQQAHAGYVSCTTGNPFTAARLPAWMVEASCPAASAERTAGSSACRADGEEPGQELFPWRGPLPLPGFAGRLRAHHFGGMSAPGGSAGADPSSQPPGVVSRISISQAELVGQVRTLDPLSQPQPLACRLFRPPRALR
jgi:hypothetical protein